MSEDIKNVNQALVAATLVEDLTANEPVLLNISSENVGFLAAEIENSMEQYTDAIANLLMLKMYYTTLAGNLDEHDMPSAREKDAAHKADELLTHAPKILVKAHEAVSALNAAQEKVKDIVALGRTCHRMAEELKTQASAIITN